MKSTASDASRINQTRVLTVNELADFLRVHRSTVYRLLKTRSLPPSGLVRTGASTVKPSMNG